MKKSNCWTVERSATFEALSGYRRHNRQIDTRKSKYLLLDHLLYRITRCKSTLESPRACMAAIGSLNTSGAGHEMESVLKINPELKNFGIYEIIKRDG